MKVPLTVSIDQADSEMIKHFCEVSGFPVSRLFEDHVKAICGTIKAAGLDKKKKYSKLDMVKMFVKGTMQPI